jgi:ribosomal protein S18 acetylase RimI-like enzyme
MRIEAGDPADADAVAELWVALAEEQTAYGSRVDPAANRASVREAAAGHAVADGLLVAREDGVVGFVMFHLEDDTNGRRGVVENLYVRPAHRGRGVGSRLLANAEARLSDRDAEFVSLAAMADNEAARRFYRRHGYRCHRVCLEKPLESDTDSRDER